MKFFKKVTSIVLSMFFLVGAMGIFSACRSEGDESDEEKLYDVTIVIGSDDGEWVFPPNVTELHTTREYDGQEHRYGVRAYRLADHPRWGDMWFTPSGEGANVFSWDILYTDLEGNQSVLRTVKDRGEYIFTCEARATSDLWNFRYINLYITVE